MWLFVIILPLATSFLICLLLVPPTIRLAKIFNLIDDPKKHHHPAIIHKNPTPRAGGLPIFLAILIGSLIFLPKSVFLTAILFTGSIVVAVGLLDDKYDLSPYLRFVINILCAAIVVGSGATIPFITNPFGGILHFTTISFNVNSFSIAIPVSAILAILWIVWVMNMLNWSKGVDGQMPGIASISAVIIGIASLRFATLEQSNIATSQMAFVVAGASLGFLVFNFYPAKIFPGYSSTILGFIIGILSISSSVKLATALLVMGIPTTDALITILRRLLAKRSPFWHDKGHLHHLLLDVGFSQRKIAVFYWVMSALLGFLALSLSSRGKLFAIILVLTLVSGSIIILRILMKKKEEA